MTIPVWVEQQNGKFVASLLGAPTVTASGDTKESAVAALESNLVAKQSTGQLVWLTMPALAVSDLAGAFPDSALWDEVCEEAYRSRDEQKAAEFPE